MALTFLTFSQSQPADLLGKYQPFTTLCYEQNTLIGPQNVPVGCDIDEALIC